ncbi:glycosyltransferase [Leptolyngbya sp. GB1-A1]|uniref:glycosyltransferase n=1 Tax=Leptolyngbya sp. GB1-A1 TaxID=2933908 RepID=UPI003296DF5A
MGAPLRIAYLVNQYPKVSHSFIRREIAGVEACGIEVLRYSIRSCQAELVDPLDQKEAELTRTLLEENRLTLLLSLLRTLLTKPIGVLGGLRLAWKLGRASDRGILRHLIYWLEACILLQWFAEAGVQHVHAHFGTNSTTVAMLCAAIGGPPYSFTIHGPEEFDTIAALSIVEKIKRSAFVVTVSSFGKSQLFRWCAQSQWSKIFVVHCGVDRDFLAQPATPTPLEPRLVCVGRLCEDKGQLLLVEAVRQLVSEGVSLKLVLVGDGALRQQIEELIARSNLKNYVEIAGWMSNSSVRQEVLASRAFVLPSFSEGLPVAIMEALALHRPVISTYIAGIPELVIPEVSGWLVPAGSVEALTAAIRAVLQSPPEVLQKMGQAGAEQVAFQHDVAIEARKLAALFGAVLETSAPLSPEAMISAQ